MIKKIPSIKLPIIDGEKIKNSILTKIMSGKKIAMFGVPGAFTPTCSEKHLPGFINLNDKLKAKGIHEIYCISVNDIFVMKAWLQSYPNGNLIKGIADGNANFVKKMKLMANYSSNFMGIRSKRFSLIANNNKIINLNIEKKGEYFISSAEHLLKQL